jgi:hypothetical protein
VACRLVVGRRHNFLSGCDVKAAMRVLETRARKSVEVQLLPAGPSLMRHLGAKIRCYKSWSRLAMLIAAA